MHPAADPSAYGLNPDLVDCKMQVTIITGAGQGLGAAAAKLFSRHGAKLVVTDLDGSKAEQVRPACVCSPCMRYDSLSY